MTVKPIVKKILWGFAALMLLATLGAYLLLARQPA
jgi:hypothetical protein